MFDKIEYNGVNLSVQDLLCQDTRIQDLYFNISEMKLSITLLFSVQIMSYLRAADIMYYLLLSICLGFSLCVIRFAFIIDCKVLLLLMLMRFTLNRFTTLFGGFFC